MNDLRACLVEILIETDIVARGIDIDDISMVVNYDVPREAEDYVHRIGRTARANNDGKAVTFVSERDRSKFKFIEQFLGYEVRCEELPPEFGNAPSYSSEEKRSDRRPRGNGKPRRNRPPRDKSRKPKATVVETGGEHQAQNAGQSSDAQEKRKKRRYYRPPRKNKASE
ncbi:MAG: DEAD/DEAH box helicase [Muribaculaceae bacterium]|nr:DEAD/DEAH box helicase [Muribaculaceae bacterium]